MSKDRNAQSAAMLARAREVIPGGINSARRRSIPPVCVDVGLGAHLRDVDGNGYIDFHAAYGAIGLGHSYEPVVSAVEDTLRTQILFGVGVTEAEICLAERIVSLVPCAEQAVVCGSGSEATYHAIRLARAATKRKKIVKFEGHYHGFHDAVLVSVMSETKFIAEHELMSAGMLERTADETLICVYNDLESVRAAFAHHGDEIAAVIVEPIAHNGPTILPADGFLAGLRAICDAHASVLIFDEMITGFRHHLGGYQAICGVTPDLSTFGKAIANGLPLAGVAGPRSLLEQFNTADGGDVTFAGTYNGNAVGVAAALATIEVMEREPVHEHTFRLGARHREGLREIAAELGVPAIASGFGPVSVLLFMEGELSNYRDALRNDLAFGVAYRQELIRRGIFEMPDYFGRSQITFSHTDAHVDRALEVSREALAATVRAHGIPGE